MDGLNIKIKKIDEDEQVFVLRPRNIVAFEQKWGKGFGKLLEDQKLEHMYWLAWNTLQSNGIVVKPFGPEFLDTLDHVELTEDPSSVSTEKVLTFAIGLLSVELQISPTDLLDAPDGVLESIIYLFNERRPK